MADASHPVGLHRVLEPAGVLPQAAWRLDTDAASCGPTRSGSRVERLNLDAASLPPARPTSTAATGTRVRAEVLEIVATRGKMQNPVTGSGGMLVGTVEEVGPDSPLGLAVGRPGRHAGLADADPAAHHRRPGRAGTAAREQVPVRRARDPVRPLHRRACCPTTCRAELALP